MMFVPDTTKRGSAHVMCRAGTAARGQIPKKDVTQQEIPNDSL